MFPQARKHCWNGDADTDCDWDNKQNGNKTEKIEKVRKTKKADQTRKIKKAEKTG